MGDKHSKPEKGHQQPQQKAPDITETLIQMKMKSKAFSRESNKSLKEKDRYYTQAKQAMQKGNEEGARMFLELAQQKQNEYMQYMRLAHRLEVIQGQIRSKTQNASMVNDLAQFTPILQATSNEMPIEQMYMKLEQFSTAYDDLQVKGMILEDGMDKTLGEKGGYKNVDNMMAGLKAEVAMDMGVNAETAPPQAQVQQEQNANQDFYADLKNL